ncbi:MAG: aldehyde dehydrogenase family protein [Candidatus Binatia bacterium]
MSAATMFIDGRWVAASNGATYEVPNPATEEIVGSAPDATVEDVQSAIAAARRAFDDGPWPRSSRQDRARVLTRIADGLERRKEELRRLVIAEAGAAHVTHDVQLEQPIRLLRNYADLVLGFAFETPLPNRASVGPLGPQMISGVVCRQPVGVCGMIPTWNFPLFVAVQKLGPALATGCTMVVKPSPWGPLVNLVLAEIVAEADLPPGVVNVVTSQDPAIGAALCSDHRVDKISFTGSVPTGKRIMETAAKTLKRVHLELGGKSVGIYLDTDNLSMNAMIACGPAMFHAGQGCAMATRVLVRREVHDQFVREMVQFVQSVVTVGDPADPAVVLGPVIRPERRAAIEQYIAAGREQGATLATGGGRPKDLPKGWFLEPTIFCDVPNDIRIAQEEIFGPVVSVIPFRDEDEAVRIANDSAYGLGGAIYSANTAAAVDLAKRIRTGVVWVNNGINMVDAPFGGFKGSGLGREGGTWGMEEYTEIQHVGWTA